MVNIMKRIKINILLLKLNDKKIKVIVYIILRRFQSKIFITLIFFIFKRNILSFNKTYSRKFKK